MDFSETNAFWKKFLWQKVSLQKKKKEKERDQFLEIKVCMTRPF